MIVQGFRIRLTADELKVHCLARADYHSQRAIQKETELPSLKEALHKIAAVPVPSGVSNFAKGGPASYSFDPAQQFERIEGDIKNHRNRATVFAYFADHLFDAEYSLDNDDLTRLEITR